MLGIYRSIDIKDRYIIDTNVFISYFSEVFEKAPEFDGSPTISKKVIKIIRNAIFASDENILLSIPSIVFIEIYEKWLQTEEFRLMFFYEVFTLIKQSPNIEIRSLDQEVLENLLLVDGCLEGHDLHDKLIVASAITLECAILSVDPKIVEFVGSGSRKIPNVFN